MRFLTWGFAALMPLLLVQAESQKIRSGSLDIQDIATNAKSAPGVEGIRITASLAADSLSAQGGFGQHGRVTVDTEKLAVSKFGVRENIRLEQLYVCNFPEHLKPRNLRLNGELLRRGNIFYNRKTQCFEALELGIPLQDDFQLTFQRRDREASLVECPVSYAKRNELGEIEEAACSAPCSWEADQCALPVSQEYGYIVDGADEQTELGVKVPLAKIGPSLFNQSVEKLAFELFQYSDQLLRLKIYDPAVARYEVPISLNLLPKPITDPLYEVLMPAQVDEPFAVNIVRKSTGSVIFDTSLAGITFEDKLLNIAVAMPNRNLYGLGENYHSTFRRVFDDTTWPVFSRDEFPDTEKVANLYGTHPHYVVIEGDGSAHGVLLYSSNAMEYQLQSATPAVNFRTTGGVLDFYIMLGPTPEEVTKQYLALVGKPFLPPHWSLGFQLSRWGYNSLDAMKEAIDRTLACGFPLDVFYGDIDMMDDKGDFTYDPVNFAGFPEYIEEMKEQGIRFVPIIDPAIPSTRAGYEPYTRGLAADAYIKWDNGSNLIGNVWPPEPVTFPDFFRPETHVWWAEEIQRFYEVIKFDGLWIDMNEPANFETNMADPNGKWLICDENEWDDPPYLPKAAWLSPTKRLSDKTICMSANHEGFKHYDVHSLYGWSETGPTLSGMQLATGKRGFVFTRSSFVGSGALGGHWTGDNSATWEQMQFSIVGLLDFNLFGIPYVGADICGFIGTPEEELCERWQMLGAYYPFSRNHNIEGTEPQDPCIWPTTVGASGARAMVMRYFLVPYLYTLFYRVHTGLEGTVIRSLAWEYPQDNYALDISDQFLWGSSFMVSPALTPGQESVVAYFPKGTWYNWHFGRLETNSSDVSTYKTIETPHDHIPLHIRGGNIIPVQEIGRTLSTSKGNPFGLTLARNPDGSASGDLFWDDGESIDTIGSGLYYYGKFTLENNTLSHEIIHDYQDLMSPLYINSLNFLGLHGKVPVGLTGDVSPDATLNYIQENDKLVVYEAKIPLNINFKVNFIYN